MPTALEIDDFRPGMIVQTPTGRAGIVLTARGAASKRDHFERLAVHFGGGQRDSVVLQPHMLKPIGQPARFWQTVDGQALLADLRARRPLSQAQREALTAALSIPN